MGLQEKLLSLREELDRREQEQSDLKRRLAEIEAENRQYSSQYLEVEHQNNNLANLYVASYQLHGTMDREEVVAAIQEIVINLIGSEEFAIVGADEQLTPYALFGVKPHELAGLSPEMGIIKQARTEQRTLALMRGMPTDSTRVRVCIPLQVGETTHGYVLIFNFLPQKEDLQPLDHELFSLVGTQAAAALFASELVTRESLANAS